MKKKYTLLMLSFVFLCSLTKPPITKKIVTKAPITTGNLIVFRAGDGAAALSSASTSIFLDEYSTTGTLIQSIAVPTSISGANLALTCAGSSTAEGQMTRSTDGRYIFFMGYNAAAGTSAIASTTAAATNRVVGRLDISTGAINTSTGLNSYASAGNVRCATSTNGTDIWICSSNNGVAYTTIGATTFTQLSTTPTNIRTVNIFNNQLFITTASGAFQGISAVGTGTPTTAGQTIVLLPGFPTTAGPSPNSFSIKPITTDVAYVADDRAIASGGGVQKWVLSGGTWTLAYTLNIGLTAGVRGLSVDWSGTNPVLYGTTADVPSKLIKFTDVNASSSSTTLVTANTNTAFRGIAFVGTTTVLPIQLGNISATNFGNYVKINWSNFTESNVVNYVIERSENGVNFNAISTINAVKNNSNKVDYVLIDSLPIKGNNFYRIRCNEIDGKFIYSKVINVIVKKNEAAFNVFPNPVNGKEFTYQTTSLLKGVYSLRLINIEGKEFLNITINHAGGVLIKTLQVPTFAKAGMYTLQLKGNKINNTKPILIQCYN